MANVCQVQKNKGQTCNNCLWFKLDEDRSAKYGKFMYSCCAKPDRLGVVFWCDKNIRKVK